MKKMILGNDLLFENVLSLLSEGKAVTIPVKGYSMLPFIVGEHDLVKLENVSSGVNPDDIVLFKIEGRFILHRILSIKDGLATIQGDGAPFNQEVCPLENIYGRVTAIFKNGKKEVDPYSERMLRKVHWWQNLGKRRRLPLSILRRLPWIKSKSI